MTLAFGLQTIVTNVGVSFEWIIILILIVGCLIFFAKSFQVGIMMMMLMSGVVFVWFHEVGLNYTIPLVMFFMCVVILALTLASVQKTSPTGGFN